MTSALHVQNTPISQTMNVSHNFWGTQSATGTLQRIFDFDDWNVYARAAWNPYYVTEENFIDWWWQPSLVGAPTVGVAGRST